MKPVIWLIGGTSEGRRLVKDLANYNVDLYVSVATDYGASLIEPQANLHVMSKRMDLQMMLDFLSEKQPVCVIDATHPYATIVTATIMEACQKAECEYLRLLRPASTAEDCITVHDFTEAVELLNHLDGNIFLTTGSKNLKDFANVHNYAERIALRILPMKDSLDTALELGYKPANVICMQGPFSKELNVAMFKKHNARFVVTKDSGDVGGFTEKVQAAADAGARLIVVGRATEEKGAAYNELISYLHKKLDGLN